MDRRLDFTVDPVNFAGLKDYAREIRKEGVRFIILLDPAINAEVKVFTQGNAVMECQLQVRHGNTPSSPSSNWTEKDMLIAYVWPRQDAGMLFS